jgi:hypothetical protein
MTPLPTTTKPKHPGGRPRGSRNKLTIEREEKARIAEQMLTGGKPEKLGKQVLHDFMELFAGMAAAYQPLPPGVVSAPGRTPDDAKFEKYARLAVDTAAKLAEYQSPKLKAIAVVPPPLPPDPRMIDGEKVVALHDAEELSRIYQRRVQAVR